VQQIRYTREIDPPGQVFWGMKSLMPNHTGLAEKLQSEIYTSPALAPATPWLAGTNAPPAQPLLTVAAGTGSVKLDWAATDTTRLHAWLMQRRVNGHWLTDILPATRTSCELAGRPELIAITAVDRMNRTSRPAVVELK
jgi:hypothetical protein